MTLQLPTLLALLGAALMGLAIFAPHKAAARPAPSAPRIAQATISTWQPEITDDVRSRYIPIVTPAYSAMSEDTAFTPVADTLEPADTFNSANTPVLSWPALVDPQAAGCDAAVRRELALALSALSEPWCEEIIRRALDEEPDGIVRLALLAGSDVGELTVTS
jgi:hypothetical protein